jgi:aminopeptidase-like protein
MKQIIEDLYGFNRCLLGEGFDNALLYINKLIPLDVLEFPSGTQVGTWTVPDEWIVRDAYVEFEGERLVDYKSHPLSLVVGSLPFTGLVDLDTLKKHLHYSDEQPSAYLYEHKYYQKDWGVCIPKIKIYKKEGDKTVCLLKEGKYRVHIDTEYRPGTMKVATHTIKGKTDREILLFAHLDGPFQANNNLSGVAALIDLVSYIKPGQYDHTIKIVFCPSTIGSIAYANTQDISKVEFMIAVDSIGNSHDGGPMLQWSFDKTSRINTIAALALRGMGGYRQGAFRCDTGSDEYVFNDPKIGIPGIMFTSHPYNKYHTSYDTPEFIYYSMMVHVQKAIVKIIEYYEKDFIPERKFTGPLFRSKYGIQSSGKPQNLAWDYFIYAMDGSRTFSSLCLEFGLNYELTYDHIQRLVADGQISCSPVVSKGNVKKTPRKKSKGL